MKTNIKTMAVTTLLSAVILCAFLSCGGVPPAAGKDTAPALTVQKGLPFSNAGSNYQNFIVKRSPDGNRYAAAISSTSNDSLALKIWDAQTNRLLHTFPAAANIFDFEWSADGRWIAMVEQEKGGSGSPRSGTGGTAAVLDTMTGTRVVTIDPSDPVTGARFSADNRYVRLSNGNIYEASSGRLTEAPPRATFREPAESEHKASAEAMLDAIHERTDVVKARNTEASKGRGDNENLSESVLAVSWDAGGSKILALSRGGYYLGPQIYWDYRLAAWDASTGSLAKSVNISLAYNPDLLRPSPDGTTAAINRSLNGLVLFYNTETGRRNESYIAPMSGRVPDFEMEDGIPANVESFAWSPNGTQAAVINVVRRGTIESFQGDEIGIYDTASGKLVRTLIPFIEAKDRADALAKREQFYDIAWSPDGSQLAAVGLKNLRIWNPANGTVIVNAAISEKVNEVKYTRGSEFNARQIFFTGAEGTAVSYNADGKQLAFGRADGSVVLYDTQARRELRTFAGLTHRIVKTAFTPDSSRIVAVDVNGAVSVWNAASGEAVLTAQARFSANLSPAKVSISPDASRAAFVAADAAVEVLNIASGKSATLAMWSPTEWAAAAAEGISFIASPSAVQYINVRSGSKAEPVSAPEPRNNPAALLGILKGE